MNKFRKAISATLIASIMTPSLVVAHPVIQTPENTKIVQALEPQSVTNSVEDGVYTAPVEVAHASNPGQKSMANGAIVSPAKLIYSGDKVTIELEFKGLKLYGMSGHLTSLFFYKENKDPLNNGEAIKAEVVKKFQDTGLDGNEYNFPQVFRYTMDKSLFENSEFLWCKVWVDAMDALQSGEGNPIIPGSGEQNAKIVVDKTKFTKVILNTQDLSNAIKAAKDIVKGNKKVEEYNTLQSVIAEAENVLKEATDQEDLDKEVTTLQAAVEAFKASEDVKLPAEDGIYMASVEIGHASNPGQKSMANGAIDHIAKLILKEGKVKVVLTFKGMDLNGMKGHLTNLFYFENNTDPKSGGRAVETKIEKNFTDTGMDGKTSEFPQVFSFTMDRNLFEASEFIWCRVWVDVMDGFMGGPGKGAQEARIIINKEHLKKVVLNPEALTKEIETAKAIEQGKKTDEAFSKLKEAITSAEEVLNSATDQEALNQGVATLKIAVEAFNNSPDKEAKSELVKYVKLNVEDGGPTDPKIRNILDDYAEIVKLNEKNYLRLTYFSVEKRSNGLDYGTKQLKYSYEEAGEKIDAIGKVIESGQNSGEYELSQIDIPIDGKSEVYLFGEFMASIYNNNKIPGKAIVRFSDSDIQGKTFGNTDKYIVSQKGFTQKEGTEKLEFDVEKDGKIYTPYTSLEKGKFKIINHGSGEIAIKIKRNSFLLGDLRHIKYTLDGTEPTADSKEAGLRNENKPAIEFDKYFVIYLAYEDVENLKETGGDIKVKFKGFNKDFTQSTESKEITVSFSKEAYDELEAVKDETNNISFKADSSREYCFNSTTTLKVENINDSELSETFNKLAENKGVSGATAYKLSFVDNNETAKLDIDKSWDSEKFPLIKIKVEKEGADRNYYKNTAFYEVVNGKLVQLPYNYLIKKVAIKNPESIYVIGQKNYDTQLQEAKAALQDKMNQIETNVTGNSLAEINLKNLLEKAKNLGRKTLNNILEINYQIDRNFEIINEGKNSDSEINKELAKELIKCINSDIYKEIFTKDFYNQVVEIKNELEDKLQSEADLKDDLLKLDNLFKDPKYALPYKVTSVEIKRQDRDDPSMAGGCFMEEGKILYGKDENYLLLNLKTMSPGFLNAHLLELSVFKDRIDEDKLDVMSIYKYSDVMSGTSKLGIFDKQILVKLPKIEKDTYFIRVANDGMQGAAPGARLKFTAKGDLIEDEPQAPLQKEALTKEIASAKEIAQGKKTEEAFNTLKAAITTAEKVLGEATEQTQLDEAVKTLKAAVKAFNESADKVVPVPLEKEALTKEIAEAKKVEQGKKTDEAFNTLKAAITTAEKVLEEATEQTQLDEAVTKLKAAVKAFNESADKEVAPQPQPQPQPQPKPSYPNYPIYPWYNNSTKVSTSKTNKNTEIKKEEVKNENLNQGRFTDINGHWANKAINYVVNKGYFAGVSKTEFAPDKPITRGEFVTILGRMLKIDTSKYSSQRFNDVNSSTYYSPYVTWANEVGIVSGVGGGNFAPDKALTREEMAVMMVKFLKISGKNISAKGNDVSFKDEKNIESWAKDAVVEMAKFGLVNGMEDGSFSPKTEFTRAQVAQVLYNIYNK